ncbi:MAG: hypothetical protein AAB534_00465 [Patescibacteria group bacterium]
MKLLVKAEGGGFGHRYFSAKKFCDPVSHRHAPTFKSPLLTK